MRFVGERRALAAVVFAFYFLVYLVLALQGAAPQLSRALYAIAGVYGLAFFALVAGYFWARWYSVGVGLYGLITAAVGMWQMGPEPVLIFVGGTHMMATMFLWGQAMSQGYDGRTEWRERFHMDDNAVQRLGRSVIRAGVSLPFVLLYALAPKPDAATFVMSLGALALAGLGLRALVQLRTWGVLALGAAGALMLAIAGGEAIAGHEALVLKPALGGALLVSAAVPWLRSMASWLRRV